MIHATLIGEKSLIAKLTAFQKNIPNRGDDAVKRVAEVVAVYAIDFAPVDTGMTKDNINVQKSTDGWMVVADRGGLNPEVPIFLEFGTTKMEPRPFMQPAIDLVVGTNVVEGEVRAMGGLLG